MPVPSSTPWGVAGDDAARPDATERRGSVHRGATASRDMTLPRYGEGGSGKSQATLRHLGRALTDDDVRHAVAASRAPEWYRDRGAPPRPRSRSERTGPEAETCDPTCRADGGAAPRAHDDGSITRASQRTRTGRGNATQVLPRPPRGSGPPPRPTATQTAPTPEVPGSRRRQAGQGLPVRRGRPQAPTANSSRWAAAAMSACSSTLRAMFSRTGSEHSQRPAQMARRSSPARPMTSGTKSRPL